MLGVKRFILVVGCTCILGSLNISADIWMQTDWSGGTGQEFWSDSTKYYAGTDVDGISLPGDLILVDTTELWQDGDPDWVKIGDSSNVLMTGGNARINIRTITYDFSDTVNNKAYKGADTLRPPMGLEIGTEFDSGEYDTVSSSDDQRFKYSQNDASKHDFHRFKFKIDKPLSIISKIYAEHEGWGWGYVPGGPGHFLYIWNVNSSNWEEVGNSSIGFEDAVLCNTYTEKFSDYIDSLGYLQLLAQSKNKSHGCCPFLYTWDGEKFVFITDINTPGGLGYEDATHKQKYYRPQSEDYVKIDGNELRPKDGFYSLEIAEDQDEIAYIDRVKLLVVDHPKGTEIYSPRMLRYTEPFPFKIYTIKEPMLPRSAVDENGNDILSVISKVDRNYTNAEQYHWNVVTVDLGDLSKAKLIKLLYNAYTEWPTEEDHAKRSEYLRLHPAGGEGQVQDMPYIEVINENGKWAGVSEEEHFGLPQSRPRTKVLDITSWFKTNDYRIRIYNFNEVHIDWIAVDITKDEEVRVTELEPISTKLYWKGVALQYSPDGKKPLLGDYYKTISAPGFEYFEGKYTRPGDVLSLLNSVDDKFVIMQAGDCISIKFKELPLNEDMQRDYYLLSDLYYKLPFVKYLLGDEISRVEPLPFQKMSAYPYPENESYPYDEEHNTYLEEYNTRKFKSPSGKTAEHHTIFTDYTKIEATLARAFIVSDVIAPSLLSTWDKFCVSDSTKQDTTEIIYSILDAKNDSVLLDSIVNLQDISSITVDSVKLKAMFATYDTVYSSVLCDWGVSWDYYKSSGTLTSSIYSVGADSIGSWDIISWDIDKSKTVTVETRTRNDPPDSIWSDWVVCTNSNPVPSPKETRYIQYKVTLESSGEVTPVLHNISIDYTPGVGVESSQELKVIPYGFSISPKPAKDRVFIRYSVPGLEGKSLSPVSIKIFSVEGRLVKDLVKGEKLSGCYDVIWNGKDEHNKRVPNGTYFCRLIIGEQIHTDKIIILR
ncbi:T9SS type A sorting domain-containing protein [candidate division WOR-3 bacterium]|nr:T9SS type A sorting domain-containing protein [candidate division WOR-3 bacterium]